MNCMIEIYDTGFLIHRQMVYSIDSFIVANIPETLRAFSEPTSTKGKGSAGKDFENSYVTHMRRAPPECCRGGGQLGTEKPDKARGLAEGMDDGGRRGGGFGDLVPLNVTQIHKDPKLPRSWTVFVVDESPLYYNQDTQVFQWKRPEDCGADGQHKDSPMGISDFFEIIGWLKCKDDRNRTYFYHPETQARSWVKPTVQQLCDWHRWQNTRYQSMRLSQMRKPCNQPVTPSDEDGLGALPDGWEKRRDLQGADYFVNVRNGECSSTDPRRPRGTVPALAKDDAKTTAQSLALVVEKEEKVASDDDLRRKMARLRSLCYCKSTQELCEVKVKRSEIFETSFGTIYDKSVKELRGKLSVTFEDEPAMDPVASIRDWFILLTQEILNPMYGLFKYADVSQSTFRINPESSKLPHFRIYYRFVGRVFGLALFHEKLIFSGFNTVFFKKILGLRLELEDMEAIDPQLYDLLVYVRENNVEDLDLYFAVDYVEKGKFVQHELKLDGKHIKVCEANKFEYLTLMMEWFSSDDAEQSKAILYGFDEVFPCEWLGVPDERDLEMLLCGVQEVDIDDWERNTDYKGYGPQAEPVRWFWATVRGFDTRSLIRFLQFVTGTCRVPLGGFAALQGAYGPQKFTIERADDINRLPRSRKSLNQIQLPPYRSLVEMKSMLLLTVGTST
ncbi:NEDD4-like E3 ubiquitin-protein ligase WWP1 [Galendromus occidentalis]|uniref:HECT-type E3 ubiquitin transferase n=1 Tax=Galendromus occidentalis TaxID=34638 RepID=A0AAJ7SEN7_9ACAR|nr:NEDD4-like E3 ubiquitin-protein ligase WWP1 [Galendromus occidentalis]